MVWLAAGTSTALLGLLVYRYYLSPVSQTEVKAKSSAPLEKSSGSEPEGGCGVASQKETLPEQSPLPRHGSTPIIKEELHANDTSDREPSIAVYSTIPTFLAPSAQSMAPPPIRASSPPRLKPPTFSTMPAPPRSNKSNPVRPPPSAAASLRVPQTKVLSSASMAPSSSNLPASNRPSRQVILQPGHSPLDWAMLTSSANHILRGKDVPDQLIRVSPSQLKSKHGRKGRDAWAVYKGKVYNITPYLPFHPGGESELMRGAGKDAGKLFMEVHPWVSWDGMLAECLVGILVGEGEEKETSGMSGGLDEMD